jgi:hypothetical protein
MDLYVETFSIAAMIDEVNSPDVPLGVPRAGFALVLVRERAACRRTSSTRHAFRLGLDPEGGVIRSHPCRETTVTLRNRVRPLSIGAIVALAVLTLSTAPTYAEKKADTDSSVRCYRYNPETGEHEFYLVGEAIVVKDSQGNDHVLTCINTGNWDDITRPRPPSRQVHASPGGATLHP